MQHTDPYWRRPLEGDVKLSTEIINTGIQSGPMQVVGRSAGGMQMMCISNDNKLYILMDLQDMGWSVIGNPLSIAMNTIQDLYGVCFCSDSVYVVLCSVSVSTHYMAFFHG